MLTNWAYKWRSPSEEDSMRRALVLLISALALQLACTSMASAQHGIAVAIVVNRSQKIGDMSLQDVRKLFLGEKGTLPNGQRVSLLMTPPGTPEREAVLRQIYRMSENEFTKYVLQSAFTGRQSPPREVPAAEMKKLVAANPNAIGYLPVTQVDDAIRAILVVQ
jgi:hypothetical protein